MNPTNPQPAPQNPPTNDAPQPLAPPTPPSMPAPTPVSDTPVAAPPVAPISEVPTPAATPESTPTPAPTEQAPVAGTVVMGGEGGSQPPVPVVTSPKKRWTRKRFLLLIALPLVLALIVAGVVFGLYLPNTPDGVWNTGLNRTGTALGKLTTTATEAEQLDKLDASKLTGKIDATWEDGKFTGDIEASFDKEDLDSGLNAAITDDAGTKQEMSAKLLTQMKKDAKYPDVYFQLSGFSAMGLDTLAPGINDYDGKWVMADSAYIESMVESWGLKEDETKQEDVTSADIHEVAKAITNVTNEYVFTTDAEKAVLVKKSFVGKEDLDGGQSHHYKASINNANAKAYCTALTQAVLDTKAAKKLSGADDKQIAKYKKDAVKDCDQDYVPKEDLDVWIGGKYRLIQKVRFNVEDSKDYMDVGQKYDNGDQITLYAAYTSEDKSTVSTSVTLNVKTYDTSFDVVATGENYDVKVNLTSKASDEDIQVTPPTGAVPIQEFIDAMNEVIGGATGFDSAELSQLEAEEEAANAGILQ